MGAYCAANRHHCTLWQYGIRPKIVLKCDSEHSIPIRKFLNGDHHDFVQVIFLRAITSSVSISIIFQSRLENYT